MSTAFTIIVDALVIVGLAGSGLTVYGLIRLPGGFLQLHAASALFFVGVIPLLVAAVLADPPRTLALGLLVLLFLAATTPLSMYSVARGLYLQREGKDPGAGPVEE